MKINVKTPIPISYIYEVKINQCSFCSFNVCLCNVTFQELVDNDL